MPWQWTYELTAEELFGHHETGLASDAEPVIAPSELIPFPGVPKKPLGGFTYQAAITSEPRPESVWQAMLEDGVGPWHRSGDRRSGIVLFDGEVCVGHYTDPGFAGRPEFLLFVRPEYRGKGVGQLLLQAWWLEFPRHTELHPRQVPNQHADRAMRAAFEGYLERCANGECVQSLHSLRHSSLGEVLTQDYRSTKLNEPV